MRVLLTINYNVSVSPLQRWLAQPGSDSQPESQAASSVTNKPA